MDKKLLNLHAFIALSLISYIFLPDAIYAQQDAQQEEPVHTISAPTSPSPDIRPDNSPDTDLTETTDADLKVVEEVVEETAETENDAYQQALASSERYKQEITALENTLDSNVYNTDLIEAQISLGNTLQKLGQHEDAIESFNMALQSIRTNSGLYSIQQLPVVNEIRESNEALGNWEAVDSNAHLRHHIAVKNYSPGDSQRINAASELGQWKLRLAREELLSESDASVIEAIEIYKSEIRNLEAIEPYDGINIHLASMYLGEAAADFAMAGIIYNRPLKDYLTGTPNNIQQRQCFPVMQPDGRLTMVCMIVEIPDLSYYTIPSGRKDGDISRQMQNMKNAILKAYQALQHPSIPLEERDVMLEEVQRLTLLYNDFVTGNSNRKQTQTTEQENIQEQEEI